MKKYHSMPEIKPSFLYGQEHLVLLETNRFGPEEHLSYLFHNPIDTLEIHDCKDVPHVFEKIEEYSREYFLAGYFSYELGYCLEDKLRPKEPSSAPLLWLGVFERPIVFDHEKNSFTGPHEGLFQSSPSGPSPYTVSDLRLEISREDYADRIDTIRRYIEAGDIYQANFTTKYLFGFDGCYYAFYRDLKKKQEVPYNAFIKTGDSYVLSISPELFLRKTGRKVITRPMKGTMGRGKTLKEDQRQAEILGADMKNRSENLMIVDLERNDLGRISNTGSVEVTDLFTVEKYQTLYQMTSTVTAELGEGVGFMDIFKSIFPSGSVTGAPKIRAMEIIQELEHAPRGVYTGAVGVIAPGGDAVFNIPIRTVTIKNGSGQMGVGSGIVYDSDPMGEYEECRLKAEFLLKEPRDFSLIETMLWDGAFNRLPLHLARLMESAEYFDFPFDEAGIRQHLGNTEETFNDNATYKVRLLLGKDGACEISSTPIPEPPAEYTATISDMKTSSDNVFLYHKTTFRDLYDCEHKKYSAQGFFDVLFTNERGEVTEGAITNVFIKKDGVLCTPPVECGLLNGIYRRDFLSRHPDCREKVLTMDDLYSADEVYLTNSVRGMVKVELAGRD